VNRGAFLRGAGASIAGAGGAALIGACGGSSAGPSMATAAAAPSTANDHAILAAAQIAEALAVTTYTNIVDSSPFFANLEPAFQHYFTAAREEEMSHYLLERMLTGTPSTVTAFHYPPKMFADARTTLDVLVGLEDAFIAAYLLGVRDFSTPQLRVTAARIMGVESDHRALARVVAPNVARRDRGPILQLTGLKQPARSVDPPNDNVLERTLDVSAVEQIAAALGPFIDPAQARRAGFDTQSTFTFVPFTPTTPAAAAA
jgi:ferritin-like protein